MAKAGIKSASRLLPVHPDDVCRPGFQGVGGFSLDKAMPVGVAHSCRNFEGFRCFLQWAVKVKSSCPFVTHCLDDFLFGGPAGSDSRTYVLAPSEELGEELGASLAQGKTEGLAGALTILGVGLHLGQQ